MEGTDITIVFLRELAKRKKFNSDILRELLQEAVEMEAISEKEREVLIGWI